MPPKRPFSVTLLLWAVLILSGWGVTRFVAAQQAWDVLNEFDATLSPLYLSITGAGWGVAGGVLLSGILTKRSWARHMVITSIFIWLIEYWLERILFQSPRANLSFALASSVFVLIITWMITILPGTKSFFIKSEEHEQPTKNPNSE
ncbi:MAG TPA: hypothetical protein VJ972_15425 [Anaerolineales bacterium]|nr:hypothetical protein [Anaerolineales bacterium]